MDQIVKERMFSCGFKRCCPVGRVFADGHVEIVDDDVDGGSSGTIKMTREQALELAEWILQENFVK